MRYDTTSTQAVKVRVAIAAVLAIAVAGCGSSGTSSSSATAFAADFSKDRTEFRQLGKELANALGGAQSRTNAQLATELGRLGNRAQAQAAKLKQLDPPTPYKAVLDKLTAGLSAVASDLHRISRAAIRNDSQTATAATRQLLAQSAQVKADDRAISDALRSQAKRSQTQG